MNVEVKQFLDILPLVIDESYIHYTDDIPNIFTNLILMDYDWMDYRIQAEIPIEDNKSLVLEFRYNASVKSTMIVMLEDKRFCFYYDSDLFDMYYKKFLQDEIKAVEEHKAFCGGTIIIAFYNDVMEKYNDVEYGDKVEKIKIPLQ